jgi:hypothetical protein
MMMVLPTQFGKLKYYINDCLQFDVVLPLEEILCGDDFTPAEGIQRISPLIHGI